jgi:hypothetical protein
MLPRVDRLAASRRGGIMEVQLFSVKLALLCFWTLWLSITFLTNVCGGLKALGVLPSRWKFASDNYHAVVQATSVYRAPRRLAGLLFFGVVLWQLIAVALFGCALVSSFTHGALDFASINSAFAVGVGFWAALMIADEIFLRYENESWHALLLIAQLATWMSLYGLPEWPFE